MGIYINRLWKRAGWPILLWRLAKEKLGRGFGKNEGEWTGKVKISWRKISLAVGEACIAIFWPTPNFKLWILNRWVFNSSVRCTSITAGISDNLSQSLIDMRNTPAILFMLIFLILLKCWHSFRVQLHWSSSTTIMETIRVQLHWSSSTTIMETIRDTYRECSKVSQRRQYSRPDYKP